VRRLVFNDQAIDDLADLAEYIADISGDADIGESFTAELEQHCRKLARLPGLLGRSRQELRDGLRSVPHKSCLIFFRYRDEVFEVVTIVGAARDLDAYFAEAKF